MTTHGADPAAATYAAPRRPFGRALHALAAVLIVQFAWASAPQLELRAGELLSDLFTIFVMLLAPLATALLLGWWAWTGWSLPRQPRLITATRWGVWAGFLWAFGGTALFAAWFVLVRGGELFNLAFLPAFMTAPLGFIIGFALGWRRDG
jgi:hypothetical protein